MAPTHPKGKSTGPQVPPPTGKDPTLFGLHIPDAPFLNYSIFHDFIFPLFYRGVVVVAMYFAYVLRLLSVQQYGMLIHEFDPWFNFRATEYLEAHGWNAFFHWYDYMSWYPIGRPVGTTIYPGLQITAVTLYRALNSFGIHMSLNDVCVMIPAWFGSVATLLLGLMTYEVTGSMPCMAVASLLYSIIPAHTMRSMAGEFDNECIALTAMLLTFYLWVRSLRTSRSWPIGMLAGLAYGYMVAAWGGFTFVLNMVALHAGCCALADWARNTYSPSLLKAYTLFFVVGTAIATRVPPVGMTPFKSLEQLAALVCLILLWGLEASEVQRRRVGCAVLSRETFRIRIRTFFAVVAAMIAVALVVMPTGYFGPLSSRVRALFVAHTRTGNPLVDSVAEHRPASSDAYMQYIHMNYPLWMLGTLILPFMPTMNHRAVLFIVIYSLVANYFCTRMMRLLLLAGPVACVLSGALLGTATNWAGAQLFWDDHNVTPDVRLCVYQDEEREAAAALAAKKKKDTKSENSTDASASSANAATAETTMSWLREPVRAAYLPVNLRKLVRMNFWPRGWVVVAMIAVFFCLGVVPSWKGYSSHCRKLANGFSSPRLEFFTYNRQGERILIDDYYRAYVWLRENTPEDARVLSWWDYGYQITGIANRTTLADGNTWNHEHIATIGKMLTSPVEEAHGLIRHMADYVLIWAGSQQGDLGKSPHMARIGNSVYRDICPNDPLCTHFGFYEYDYSRPTPMMRKSLLYNLHENGRSGVKVDEAMFRPIYSSEHGLVRIYRVMNVSRKSKKWANDPANRICDPPGSWMCRGQYPPAEPIQQMLAKRIDFGQLEDFNRKKADDEYYRAYMARSRHQ